MKWGDNEHCSKSKVERNNKRHDMSKHEEGSGDIMMEEQTLSADWSQLHALCTLS